jgi:hypothetical protein
MTIIGMTLIRIKQSITTLRRSKHTIMIYSRMPRGRVTLSNMTMSRES